MRQNTYKEPGKNTQKQPKWFTISTVDRRFKLAIGLFLQGLALFLFIAFTSHFFHGKTDQSTIESAHEIGIKLSGLAIKNWLGLVGALSGYYCIFKWLGITAFFFLLPLYLLGHKLVYEKSWAGIRLASITTGAVLSSLWLNITLGYIDHISPKADLFEDVLGGVGVELGLLFHSLLGWGTTIFLVISFLIFLVCFFHITSLPPIAKPFMRVMRKKIEHVIAPNHRDTNQATPTIGPQETKTPSMQKGTSEGLKPLDLPLEVVDHVATPTPQEAAATDSIRFTVAHNTHEETLAVTTENYDPKLDLSIYQYPAIDLLNQYDHRKVQVTQEELAHNKDKIVETLINFKIGIASIKATIGPTVTLYEIVPEAGIKISKIKNLEDDIALSLAALGIRIIAPIPGKGTIGIEVPNKHREVVSLRGVLATDKFMKSKMELPVVLGKTIANETFIVDLASMPHLLIAGATGQGKSVGLNVVLASLIYTKHPSQMKFVLVDPKKVELSLYNKLERHFLAKLPSNEEAIITETKKVVHTLNSLCIEMDHRYELLKEAGTRNIKEYNAKFVQRKLNPQQGHRFLPYIVLVIDEFADMMMTAGKEVELPIARLAQLARAIGIHLVLATQRPSVNVITGIIKANFPVRISFKVTAKIDSRTILDTGGAEQLVGQGDMLLSMNADIIRLQCPFLATQEVERICDYIGSQRGYESAYLLPAYEEDQEENTAIDLTERDPLFEEAARLIMMHQQGSTSLIQRKLKLGYNRAGRLIDQLEAAGIVGPFEGSKAREVLVADEASLALLLKNLTDTPPAALS